MSGILLTHIKELCQIEELKDDPKQFVPKKAPGLRELPSLKEAWVWIEDERIKDFGPMANVPQNVKGQVIDLTGKTVLPCWVDSHTHLVFAATRESEFVDRIKGLSYEEIAKRGGGILNSAGKLQKTSEDQLFEDALKRIDEIISYGTGAAEIKSGYGLSVEAELKMLRVIQRLKAAVPIDIKATFLGAHAYPMEYRHNKQAYIQQITEEMLPAIGSEKLADYIDAFCENGFFSVEETRQILEAGATYGLKPKIHTNQFNSMGGIQLAVEFDALSVDHLEVVNDDEIIALTDSGTIATLLPSAPFFLNDHYPPARKLIDAGIPVALGTDYNPGSTPSGRMSFVISLACIKMKMLPEEAINAATWNGACAIELQKDYGSICKGKYASLIVTKEIPGIAFIPYSFGADHIDQVLIKGKFWEGV